MRPILFRRCRSEKEYSDDGSSEMIRAILTARSSAWKNCQIFDRCMAARVGSDDDDSSGVM